MLRILDIFFATIALIVLSPLGMLIGIWVWIDTQNNPFFMQERVGKNGIIFSIIKFRTMRLNAQQMGGLTIGVDDNRITRSGYFLRKYKLDELPQCWNILIGDMSMVGPRPELPYFVEKFSELQKIVLTVKPGLTDEATIFYKNESEILAKVNNPELYFLEKIVPHKVELNMIFINRQTVWNYLRIILKTAYCLYFEKNNQ
jgi:lipopolysaccharide/colanic/teichoic acid biosynthesis glycosyltransferase